MSIAQTNAQIKERPRSFDDLVIDARTGYLTDAIEHIRGYLTPAYVRWALDFGILDGSSGVRDLAAVILHETDLDLGRDAYICLEKWMLNEKEDIVSFRLASILWKRGCRSEAVIAKMNEATRDPDVG